MKRNHVSLVIAAVLLTLVIGLLFAGSRILPTVNHALRISELMQPMLEASNQGMHLSVSAEVGGETVTMESDVFLVTEENVRWLILDHNGTAVYVAENVLFLENGKAFKIADAMQMQTTSCSQLLPQIMALYEVLEITAEETEHQTAYSVTVTGEQMNTLLAAVSLADAVPAEAIDTLTLHLTETKEKLDTIAVHGSGSVDNTAVQLHVTLSHFRVLAAGDYPIPEPVKQSAATVNPEDLFTLTEDLYRLVLALAPFADMDAIDGTLELAVDCGLLQLDTRMALSDLKNTSNAQLDPETLQKLPEILGLMCMEGEIRCTPDGDGYLYTLELDQTSMQQLTRMILPELTKYSENLTNGTVSILLVEENITAMKASIEGKIPMLFTQVPILVSAVFHFL